MAGHSSEKADSKSGVSCQHFAYTVAATAIEILLNYDHHSLNSCHDLANVSHPFANRLQTPSPCQ